MKRTGVTSLALALAVMAGAAGCGSDSDEGGLAGSGAGDEASAAAGDSDVTLPDELVDLDTSPAEVTALDNTFDATGIRVPAGTTVRWTNSGRQDHDVIPVEGDWGVDVDGFHPGDSYEHTFAEPGTYSYYCTIHGTAAHGMVGVVVVE